MSVGEKGRYMKKRVSGGGWVVVSRTVFERIFIPDTEGTHLPL